MNGFAIVFINKYKLYLVKYRNLNDLGGLDSMLMREVGAAAAKASTFLVEGSSPEPGEVEVEVFLLEEGS